MYKYLIITILLTFTISPAASGQISESDLLKINEERLSMNRVGMTVLGGWATANIVTGAIGMSITGGNTRYFHEMNLAWNGVNLAIAGFGYAGSKNLADSHTLSETVQEYHRFEKLLLFNAGLDLGYMATGAFLWERGISRNSSRLIGYGQSMILQGGFLFAFDLVLYAISRGQSSSLIKSLDNLNLEISPTGIKLHF